MRRFWVVRNGMLLNSEPLVDLSAAQKYAREAEKDRKKKSAAKRSHAYSDYQIIEEHIRFTHFGTYRIDPERGPFWESVKGQAQELLSRAVNLVIPKHLGCESIPYEIRDKIEELLKARTARRRGRASAGDLF